MTHLNCASFHPRLTVGGRTLPSTLVAHCLLVERAEGLLLVDSGFGTSDLADPKRLGRPFRALLRPALVPAETAVAQRRALGHDPGGARPLPSAAVGARPALGHPPRRRRLLARPRGGHRAPRRRTPGATGRPQPRHSGIAVARPGGGWLLHAGDAYFSAGEKETPRTCPPGLRLFQSFTHADSALRHANQERIRELHAAHRDEVTVLSAHDPSEYAALAGPADA